MYEYKFFGEVDFLFLLDINGVVFVLLKDYVVLLVVFCERGVMIFLRINY